MQKLPYRLIALDVDGTLLNDDHELTEGTKDVVQRASMAGASIVLCTGRGPSNTLYLLDEIGLKGYLITHNGAATLKSEDGSLMHGFSYGMKEASSVLVRCRERGIHYDINSVFDMYIDQVTPTVQAMYDKFGVEPIHIEDVLVYDEPVYKISLFGTGEALDAMEAEWHDMECGLLPIRSGEQFIDLMNPLATKGNALRKLAAMMDIPREEILAIGNYFNDVAMLEFAGLGIAMDNSPEGVKAAADEVTLSNNENGVRAALLKHLFNE
jgi:Cof subfamily protein (haloacid dehalogenase superfamily)